MANSKPNSKPAALTPEEAQLLRSLLARVQASGTSSQFADVMLTPEFVEDSDGEFEHLGEELSVMSEATKRRLVADSAVETDDGYGRTRSCAAGAASVTPKAKVAPAIPKAKAAPMNPSGSGPVPDDVINLVDWGTTTMEIGKMAPAGMSYAELAQSPDPEVQRYLKWLMSALTDRFKPQYHDFVAYLNAIDYGKMPSGSAGFVRNRKGK